MSEIKPCPFCNKTDKVRFYTESMVQLDKLLWINYGVMCKRCRFETPAYAKKATAIHKWNTRPAEDAKDAEIERLKEALLQISYLRDLNPELKHHGNASCAEDSFMDFYCRMGDIAKTALANAPDTNVGTKGEQQ